MIYETYLPEQKRIIDGFVRDMAGMTWQRRYSYMVEVARAFANAPDFKDDLLNIAMMTSMTVAATIERLGAPEVKDEFQSYLYNDSASALHRKAGTEYLRANFPELLNPTGLPN